MDQQIKNEIEVLELLNNELFKYPYGSSIVLIETETEPPLYNCTWCDRVGFVGTKLENSETHPKEFQNLTANEAIKIITRFSNNMVFRCPWVIEGNLSYTANEKGILIDASKVPYEGLKEFEEQLTKQINGNK